MRPGIINVGRIASRINLAIYTDRQPSCREEITYMTLEQYLAEMDDVELAEESAKAIGALCAFKRSKKSSNNAPGNAQQVIQPDNAQ